MRADRSGPDPLSKTLAVYRGTGADEVRDVARTRALAGTRDPWSRDGALHVTASVLVAHVASGRVLLRWHPRMARWLQVGGHGDPGENDPWLVAIREAHEETGLTDLRGLPRDGAPALVQVVIVPVGASGDEPAHEHADLRYLVATDAPDTICAESDAAPLQWMTLDAARAVTSEPNLHELLDRVASRLR